jgi:ribosomal protein S25
MEEIVYDDKKIKEEILKEAENSVISVNKFATKYKRSFYYFQKIFWELTTEGKLIKLDSSLGTLFTSPNYLKKVLGLS